MKRDNCKFINSCKYNSDCVPYCYAYTLLQGLDGKGGYWATRGVPKRYENCFLSNLPIRLSNPNIYRAVSSYIENVVERVGQGRGLYFVGETGTGKTTTAITILNEYLLAKVKSKLQLGEEIIGNPVLYVRVSEFHSLYNTQFRGDAEVRELASSQYLRRKQLMESVELLVLDDVAIRHSTEAFTNELYELLDYRLNECYTTLFTSNVRYNSLSDFISSRAVSRIKGMCGNEIVFRGADYREEGCFNVISGE